MGLTEELAGVCSLLIHRSPARNSNGQVDNMGADFYDSPEIGLEAGQQK